MTVSFDYSGKVALVTGAASGMGLATAQAFAKAGAAVTLADVNETALQQRVDEITAAGGKAMAVLCDVADEDSVQAIVAQTVAAFGRLDAAFNNAGIQIPAAEIADQSIEDYDRISHINQRGVWACMKHELRQMREQGEGAIVNCSSIGGLTGRPLIAAYHGTKHGVIGLTRSAALEYATRGIRVNAVCPGTIDTPMVSSMIDKGMLAMEDLLHDLPMKRLGKSEEIASSVLWLCSSGASFVTGQALAVDGGFTSY